MSQPSEAVAVPLITRAKAQEAVTLSRTLSPDDPRKWVAPEKAEKAPNGSWKNPKALTRTPFPCPNHMVLVKPSGLFVVDIDVTAPASPKALLQALYAAYPVLAVKTLVVRTASGGLHLWFRVTHQDQATRMCPLVGEDEVPQALKALGVHEIDWIGDGLCMSPGTVLPLTGRTYYPNRLPVAPAPQRLTPAVINLGAFAKIIAARILRPTRSGEGPHRPYAPSESPVPLEDLPPCIQTIATQIRSGCDNDATSQTARVFLVATLYHAGWSPEAIEDQVFRTANDYVPTKTQGQLRDLLARVQSPRGFLPHGCAKVQPLLPGGTCSACPLHYVLHCLPAKKAPQEATA